MTRFAKLLSGIGLKFQPRAILAALALVLSGGASPGFAAGAEPAKASQTPPPAAQTQTTKPPAVTIAQADQREMVATALISGTLVAREEILVAPEIEGLVLMEILADEGARIEKGQVLARLNRASLDVQMAQNMAQLARLDAAVAQAEAQIAEAEANKVQANNSFNRTAQLQASGSSSAETYDLKAAAARAADARRNAATQALAISKADRSATLATIEDTKLKLARTEIKAPKAGVISRKNAKLGAVATAIGEPLFKVIGEGLIELEAEVSEIDISKLQPGQRVEVQPAGIIQPFLGKVRLISPELDKATRLGRVRVALPENAIAFIGSFARGVVETGRQSAITVPLSALTYTKAGAALQIVQDGVVATRAVKVGSASQGRVSIVEGITPGESVIARAGSFVRDGDRVTGILVKSQDVAP